MVLFISAEEYLCPSEEGVFVSVKHLNKRAIAPFISFPTPASLMFQRHRYGVPLFHTLVRVNSYIRNWANLASIN